LSFLASALWSYANSVVCDMVPMEACSLLLGRPWEFDNNVVHHGRSNNYTFMHKGEKFTLVPLTPAEIAQADKERSELHKHDNELVANSETEHACDSPTVPTKDGMESRTTPIQEGEDDEDISTLHTHLTPSSPSYKSSPTQSPRSLWIQPTPLHGQQSRLLSGKKPEYPGRGPDVRSSTRSIRTRARSIRTDDRMSERLSGVSGFHGAVPPYFGPMGRVLY